MKFNLESAIHSKYKNSVIYRSVLANVHKQAGKRKTFWTFSFRKFILLRKIILSTQEGKSRLRSFVRISPAVEMALMYDHVHNCTSYLLCFSTGQMTGARWTYKLCHRWLLLWSVSCSIPLLCLSRTWFNIFVVPPVYVSSVSHNLHFTVLLYAVLLK